MIKKEFHKVAKSISNDLLELAEDIEDQISVTEYDALMTAAEVLDMKSTHYSKAPTPTTTPPTAAE